MNGKAKAANAAMLLTLVLGTGCANKANQRIAMLEENSADLTARLNSAVGELNAADQQYEELDRRLQAALETADKCRFQLAAALEEPEETAPGWTAVPGGAMIAIEGSVLFSPGKTEVRSQARRMLDAIISTVQGEYADKEVIVFGHTDDRPINKSGWTDNWELSAQRALAVVRYIRDRGVSPERLIAAGCGQHRPRLDNSSDANRERNRRVEIFALDSRVATRRP